jgi:hypothetical protein
MSNEKQTAIEWLVKQLQSNIDIRWRGTNIIELGEQAKEMGKERMRSYIEEKWKQYRIVTNEEDAWLFKEWLIEQTYGGNK